MVARHDQLRRRETPQVIGGRSVLLLARPLREIAADHQQRGRALGQVLDQSLDHRAVGAPEVDVGDVGDGPHRLTRGLRDLTRDDHLQSAAPDPVAQRRLHVDHFAVD